MPLITNITSSLDWIGYSEQTSIGRTQDDGLLKPAIAISSGTGLGQANEAWCASGTITPQATAIFDFRNLGFSSFGFEFRKVFNTVKVLHIINLGTGTILVRNSGQADAITFLGGHNEIGQEGVLHWYTPLGVAVPSGTNRLYLYNPNLSSIQYKLGIIGLFGTGAGLGGGAVRNCGFTNGFSAGFC